MKEERLHLGRSAWTDLTQGITKEWLVTNGLGGWAYGTVPNLNTRYYHAVLAAAVCPPVERLVLLAKLDESIVVDGRNFPLYNNEWASGQTEICSLAHLHSFSLAPFPIWRFAIGDVTVEKRLFMRHGRNETTIRYRLWRGGGGKVTLNLSPLVTCRTIHTVVHANDWPFAQEQFGPASVSVEAFVGSPRLYMAASDGVYVPGGDWVYGLHYRYERMRGEATEEDLYSPGRFTWDCTDHGELTFVASVDPIEEIDGNRWDEEERQRCRTLTAQALADDQLTHSLVVASDQFIVRRESTGTRSVIAGYPWFSDWGRDTMIALPGLTLSTRRYGLARELLHTFAAHEKDGLIPNCFHEHGSEPLYNTADASLWFFEAAWQYLTHTGDHRFARDHLYPVLQRIARSYVNGTHFAIYVAPNGLLHCGRPDVQVTWMDAKVNDWVVTPRNGFPVEIQALWFNATRILAALAATYDDQTESEEWRQVGNRAEAAFAQFWNETTHCCYDLLADDGQPDPAIRPNQLFAISLTHPLLMGEQAQGVVDTTFRHLWTPYGLRSLSPTDPGYMGLYIGSRWERDAAYHQGTVWSWLIGPFVRAYLRAYGRSGATLTRARELLEPLRAHLQEYGLGSIAENFDGDPPHEPRSCIAQAWSVAELLRTWLEVK